MSIQNIKFYSISKPIIRKNQITILKSSELQSIWIAVCDYYLPIQDNPIMGASMTGMLINDNPSKDRPSSNSPTQNHQIKQPINHTVQSQSVRLLLQSLLKHLQIDDRLIESNFPYYLENTGYFVCFSHSSNDNMKKCALVLSKEVIGGAGIDIEVRDVSWKVAQRFFHEHEIALLKQVFEQGQATNKLNSQQNKMERQWMCNQLWKMKECLIKINQTTLATGMGVDLSFLIEVLIDNFEKKQDSITIDLQKHNSIKISNKEVSQIIIDNVNQLVVVH